MNSALNRRHVVAALGALPLSLAHGQPAWPTRTLKIIVPLPPGGGVDVLTRVMAEQMVPALGQNVIIENKPGAAGALGVRMGASSTDQHTAIYVMSGLITQQAMNGRIDMQKDIRPVARLTSAPFVVAVRADSPYKTFEELVKAVKAEPNKLMYGSGGMGSPPHLAVGMLNQMLGGFKALHVPFKGAIESVYALIGEQIDFTIALIGPALPQLEAGKLRVLAVTSAQRVPRLADVPTVAESGVPGFLLQPWGGMALPPNASDANVARLAEVLKAAMASAPMMAELDAQLAMADYAGPAEFKAQIARELASERKLVKQLNIKSE